MNQLYTLGADYLRPRYVDQLKVLPGNWSRDSLYVRSTDYDRTLQSVDSLLQGLYPPGTGPTVWGSQGTPAVTSQRVQVVPVVTLPRTEDGILSWNAATCPAWNTARNAYTAKVEQETDEAGIFADVVKELSQETGIEDLNINNMYKALDGLKTDRFHGYPWPEGITEDQFNQAINVSEWTMAQWYATPTMRKQGGGYMVSLLRERFTARVQGTAQPEFDPTSYASPTGDQLTGPRVAIYSAHDLTVLTVLASLQVLQGPVENPPYASSAVFELVALPSSAATSHAVRIWYNKGIGTDGSSGPGTPQPFNTTHNVVALPGCANVGSGGDILCGLDDFMTLTEDVANADWQPLCGVDTNPPAAKEKGEFKQWQLVLGSVLGTFLGLLVGAAMVWMCMRKASSAPHGATAEPYAQI